jgi:hypothetical protein
VSTVPPHASCRNCESPYLAHWRNAQGLRCPGLRARTYFVRAPQELTLEAVTELPAAHVTQLRSLRSLHLSGRNLTHRPFSGEKVSAAVAEIRREIRTKLWGQR